MKGTSQTARQGGSFQEGRGRGYLTNSVGEAREVAKARGDKFGKRRGTNGELPQLGG